MSTDGTDGAATTRIGDPVGTEYLLGLREALSDLPPAEVEEIVEDAHDRPVVGGVRDRAPAAPGRDDPADHGGPPGHTGADDRAEALRASRCA
ncbi:hypothetical protein WHI96_07475 [Pseudonocardia tropica]|uniref:Uncharacterized protein n=1 Tax=Pseudonocardia tropica TaxID=681289 RepID=A0ABV1JRT7_9PSEU